MLQKLLKVKNTFAKLANSYGIQIKNYHADNGIFNSKAWREACEQEHQAITFSGVNAHHQNGIAERRIRVLQDMTRTSLNHAI